MWFTIREYEMCRYTVREMCVCISIFSRSRWLMSISYILGWWQVLRFHSDGGVTTLGDQHLLFFVVNGHRVIVVWEGYALRHAIFYYVVSDTLNYLLLAFLFCKWVATHVFISSVNLEHLEVAYLLISVIRECEYQRGIIIWQKACELDDFTSHLRLLICALVVAWYLSFVAWGGRLISRVDLLLMIDR